MSDRRSLSQVIAAALTPRTVKAATMSMVPTSGNGGWTSIIREPFTGVWQRNISLNAAEASSFFAVFACTTLIASDVAKLGVRLMARDSSGIWGEVENPAFSPVLRKPNSYQTDVQFWERWILSKIGKGNTYALKVRDNRRVVTEIHVLDPQRVTPLIASDGSVFYDLSTNELAGLPAQVVVPATEMFHDRYNCLFHALVGIPPIYAAALAATMGLAIQSQAARLFANNAQPGGVLSAPGHIDDDTAARIKENWQARFGGENLGRVAVLGDALKFEKLSFTSEEAQAIEQLRATAEIVCSVYHVPGYKIGVGARPSYASAAQMDGEYYSAGIQSLLEHAEACLDDGLGLGAQYGLRTEFDIDNLMRMDAAAQAETITKLVRGGVMTPNEARKRFNLPPLDGGSTVYLQAQDVPMSVAASVSVHPSEAKTAAAPAPAKAAPTGPAIGPAASGTTSKGEIEVGGKPGDGASDVARPRLPTLIVRVHGDLDDALCDRVLKEIEAAPGPIDLHICSEGGKLSVAMAICAAVEAHPHAVTTLVAKAHSGAALIGLAGDRRFIHPDGEIMVHEAHRVGGQPSPEDAQEIIARAISGYSGWSTNITRAWMSQTSVFTPAEAQRAGFVEAIIDPSSPTVETDDPPKRRPSEWLRHFRETEAKVEAWKKDGSIT